MGFVGAKMKEKLVIKNFGPITSAEIEIKKMMVFVGDSSSGKSVVLKLLSLFRWIFKKLSIDPQYKFDDCERILSQIDLSQYQNKERIVYEKISFKSGSKKCDFMIFNQERERFVELKGNKILEAKEQVNQSIKKFSSVPRFGGKSNAQIVESFFVKQGIVCKIGTQKMTCC